MGAVWNYLESQPLDPDEISLIRGKKLAFRMTEVGRNWALLVFASSSSSSSKFIDWRFEGPCNDSATQSKKIWIKNYMKLFHRPKGESNTDFSRKLCCSCAKVDENHFYLLLERNIMFQIHFHIHDVLPQSSEGPNSFPGSMIRRFRSRVWNYFIKFLDTTFLWGFLKFLRIEIFSRFWDSLSSGWASGPKFPDDWGRTFPSSMYSLKDLYLHPLHKPTNHLFQKILIITKRCWLLGVKWTWWFVYKYINGPLPSVFMMGGLVGCLRYLVGMIGARIKTSYEGNFRED